METQDRFETEHGRSADPPRRPEGDSSSVADFVRERVSQAAESVTEAAERTSAYAGEAFDQAKSKAAEYRNAGWSRIQEDVSEYTRTQPVAALAIAAGLGLLLGWISATSRR
jgi:ElaB/YqjD/DUF883 family membrane-anchored ribosome-binding protein